MSNNFFRWIFMWLLLFLSICHGSFLSELEMNFIRQEYKTHVWQEHRSEFVPAIFQPQSPETTALIAWLINFTETPLPFSESDPTQVHFVHAFYSAIIALYSVWYDSTEQTDCRAIMHNFVTELDERNHSFAEVSNAELIQQWSEYRQRLQSNKRKRLDWITKMEQASVGWFQRDIFLPAVYNQFIAWTTKKLPLFEERHQISNAAVTFLLMTKATTSMYQDIANQKDITIHHIKQFNEHVQQFVHDFKWPIFEVMQQKIVNFITSSSFVFLSNTTTEFRKWMTSIQKNTLPLFMNHALDQINILTSVPLLTKRINSKPSQRRDYFGTMVFINRLRFHEISQPILQLYDQDDPRRQKINAALMQFELQYQNAKLSISTTPIISARIFTSFAKLFSSPTLYESTFEAKLDTFQKHHLGSILVISVKGGDILAGIEIALQINQAVLSGNIDLVVEQNLITKFYRDMNLAKACGIDSKTFIQNFQLSTILKQIMFYRIISNVSFPLLMPDWVEKFNSHLKPLKHVKPKIWNAVRDLFKELEISHNLDITMQKLETISFQSDGEIYLPRAIITTLEKNIRDQIQKIQINKKV